MTEIRISFNNLEAYIREYHPWRTHETSRILSAAIGQNCIVLTVPEIPLAEEHNAVPPPIVPNPKIQGKEVGRK